MEEAAFDSYAHNRSAWNREAEEGINEWTQPLSAEVIAKARRGDWQVLLTPSRPVPPAWLGAENGRLDGKRIPGLASGGGQQGPGSTAPRALARWNGPAAGSRAEPGEVLERPRPGSRAEPGEVLERPPSRAPP